MIKNWYHLQFLRYREKHTEIANLGHFCPFTSPKSPQNQNFKMNKFPGDLIILQMCTKNYKIYSSWDMEWDRQNFLSLWAIFCLFTTLLPPPPNDSENQNFQKKWKKGLEILSFYIYMCTKIIWYMVYMVPEIQGATDKNFHNFGPLLALSAPGQPGKPKF